MSMLVARSGPQLSFLTDSAFCGGCWPADVGLGLRAAGEGLRAGATGKF